MHILTGLFMQRFNNFEADQKPKKTHRNFYVQFLFVYFVLKYFAHCSKSIFARYIKAECIIFYGYTVPQHTEMILK